MSVSNYMYYVKNTTWDIKNNVNMKNENENKVICYFEAQRYM